MEGIRGPLKTILTPAVNKKEIKTKDSGFADSLKSFCRAINEDLKAADKKVQTFAAGKPMDLHEVVIATEKADLSLRFLLQIRNKLLDGYQEIMRMQF